MQTQSFVFNNAVSVSFNEQGYLNATQVAKQFNKRTENFLRTAETQEYIQALSEYLGVTLKSVTKENQIVIVKKGGTPQEQGSWIHPKLAVFFARWLDARFAVWCDMKIEEILGINQADKLTPAQKQQIQAAVRARHHRTGEHWQEIYRKLHAYLKINSYHEIQAKDFQTALNFLASIENAPMLFTEPNNALDKDTMLIIARLLLFAQEQRQWVHRYLPAFENLGLDKQGTQWSFVHDTEPMFRKIRTLCLEFLPQDNGQHWAYDTPEDNLRRKLIATI